jgi:hypothetical protein
LDQRARVRGVIAVISKQALNQLGYDDRGGEMKNGVVDIVCADCLCDELLIANATDDKRYVFGQDPGVPCGQIVEHHHNFSTVSHLIGHMRANIPRSSCNQDGHRNLHYR